MPFINGVYFGSPGTNVTINDSDFQPAPASGGLTSLFIGPATDGEPNTVLSFTSPQTAQSILKGGDLLQGVLNAFAGAQSVNNGALTVLAIRPEIAIQATSAIKSSGATTQIPLTATSYGLIGNSSKYMIQPGSVSGYKISQATDFVGPGTQTYPSNTTDNVSLPVLSISCTGSSPSVTVSDSAFQVTAGGSQIANIALSSSVTVQQLVNQLNQISSITAVALDSNQNDTTGAFFDNVTSQTISTSSAAPTTLYANVTAVVRYFNNQNLYFTTTRSANATSLATSNTWTYATGGTTPTAATSDWQNAYTTAQTVVGANLIQPVSPSYTLWAMNDAHCQYMASLGQPRRGYLGDASGQPMATELSQASILNSNRSTIVWPEQEGVNYNGVQTTVAPYLQACFIAGQRAATVPYDALTQQPVPSNGMGQAVTPPMVTQGLAGGLAIIAPNAQGVVVLQQDRTTWLQSTAYDKVENSTGLVSDIIVTDLNATLQQFVGKGKGGAGVASVAVLERLIYWWQQGYLSVQPVTSDVSLTKTGNAITGTANAAFDVPTNYIALQLNATES